MSRLEQLLRFAEEEPGDPFNIYAVAIEYLKLNDEKATDFFETLLREHPSYVPTYYTFGKLMQERKDFERARLLFQQGIAMSGQDQKAKAELSNALSEVEFEMED